MSGNTFGCCQHILLHLERFQHLSTKLCYCFRHMLFVRHGATETMYVLSS